MKNQNNRKTILVTGGNGLVGSAIRDISCLYPQYNYYFTKHEDIDLTKEELVEKLFKKVKPDYVIHTAARVGGIGRNLNSSAQQFHENILMNTHLIHHAYLNKVEKILVFSSMCVYPAETQIISEDIMHKGEPFRAHWSYAHAKRMVDVQISAYKQQYGIKNYCSLIPGNMFGENDNFDLEDGHVIPSLIHKCFLAKRTNSRFEVWGNGSATREFLYAQDVAKVCIELLSREDIDELPERLIISAEKECSIKEIANKICNIFNFPIENIKWLLDKPSGQAERPSDHTFFRKYFPDFRFTDIDIALKNTIEWFNKNYPNVRGIK